MPSTHARATNVDAPTPTRTHEALHARVTPSHVRTTPHMDVRAPTRTHHAPYERTTPHTHARATLHTTPAHAGTRPYAPHTRTHNVPTRTHQPYTHGITVLLSSRSPVVSFCFVLTFFSCAAAFIVSARFKKMHPPPRRAPRHTLTKKYVRWTLILKALQANICCCILNAHTLHGQFVCCRDI